MRTNLVIHGAGVMSYEIRNIVTVAEKLQKHGVTVNWENIGDPIVKGEVIPEWMKEIVARAVMDNDIWGYCHTRGVLRTREFICDMTNSRGGAQITPDDIIFFNGLGDAIAKVYGSLRPETRVLLSSPAYSTHAIGESGHAHAAPVLYELRPENGWLPDLDELRLRVKFNPQVAGIMFINPDNPTGLVYPREVLEEIVEIAREFDLFIIADEVYNNIVYNGETTVPISDIIGDVPAIALKGISKELPWPGSRCGWMEIYNQERDEQFKLLANTILASKMSEVCSTTLPQTVIPEIMSHREYAPYLASRIATYEKMSTITYDFLREVPGLIVNRTNGAFYMAVVFQDGLLNDHQRLPLPSPEIQEVVDSFVEKPGVSPDKRFVYYLLASSGICTVPLSSFYTPLQGFRVTLLEKNEQECIRIYRTVAEKIREYLAS
ncbi:MAG: pyridoxal phosphate-dependent aminotransferase [Desulfuromonadia bacterium]